MLIRDVAYSMLPKSVRSRKHVEVGEFIRERAGDRVDAFAGIVAEHYARAVTLGGEAGIEAGALKQLRADALELLEAAGDAAAALYSNDEAFERYSAALELRRPQRRRPSPDRREAGGRRDADGPRRRRGCRLGALPRAPPR